MTGERVRPGMYQAIIDSVAPGVVEVIDVSDEKGEITGIAFGPKEGHRPDKAKQTVLQMIRDLNPTSSTE